MKRVLKLFLTIIILFCIFPYLVNAATTLSASTQSPVVGSSFFVELNMDYGDALIKEAHLIIEYDPDYFSLENVNFTQSRGTYTTPSTGIINIDKPSDSASWVHGGQIVFTFKAQKVGLSKISISPNKERPSYFDDNSEIPLSVGGMPGITISTVEASSSTRIGSLYVKGYSLSPIFSKTTYNYRVTVPSDVTEVEITGTKSETSQTLTGLGKRELEYGENKVRVTVTAENGESCIYEIIITRTDNRTGDVSLKRLSVTNTNIEYIDGQATYNATVSRSIDSVLITATPSDPNAILTGTGKQNLKIGSNVFTLTVKTVGSDGKTKEQDYILNIVRSEEEFQTNIESSKLISLNVNGLVLDMSNNKTTFLYGIDKDCNELNIIPVTESTTAKVKIDGNSKLKSGINLIRITVTEKTEEYTIYDLVVYKNPLNATVTNDIKDLTFEDNLLYQTTDTSRNIIPASTIKTLKSSGKTLYYNVVNVYNGLIYQIALKENLNDQDINAAITKTSSNPLTYQVEIPEGNEIILYLDGIYKDGNVIKIYSYDTLGKYTLVTDGIKVDNGYVTFNTNGQKYYIFTTSTLIKKKSTLSTFIQKNLVIIILLFIIIAVVAVFIVMKIKNKQKQEPKENEPLY